VCVTNETTRAKPRKPPLNPEHSACRPGQVGQGARRESETVNSRGELPLEPAFPEAVRACNATLSALDSCF